MEVGGFFSAVLVGLVLGALGRLVVPGRNPIGCLMTILVGIAGALVGSAAAERLEVGGLATFALQVLASALLVGVVSAVLRR